MVVFDGNSADADALGTEAPVLDGGDVMSPSELHDMDQALDSLSFMFTGLGVSPGAALNREASSTAQYAHGVAPWKRLHVEAPWCQELHALSEQALERRGREASLSAELATAANSGRLSFPGDSCSAVADVVNELGKREDRLAAGLHGMGRQLESHLAHLDAEIQLLAKTFKSGQPPDDIVSSARGARTAPEASRRLRPRRPLEPPQGSFRPQVHLSARPRRHLAHRGLLTIAWLVWVQSLTDARRRSMACHCISEALRLEGRSCRKRCLQAWRQATVSSGRRARVGDVAQLAGTNVDLHDRLKGAEVAVAARDPVLAALVSRLGGTLLKELHAASVSISGAHELLAQLQWQQSHPAGGDASMARSSSSDGIRIH